jgi:protein-tyrosine phosphatase
MKHFISRVERFLSQHNKADKIFNNVWIGNRHALYDEEFIKENEINVIINCTKSLEMPDYAENNDITTYRLNVNDNFRDILKMYKYIDEMCDKLNVHILNNDKILVNCNAGMQRSATLVAYYLIKHRGMCFTDAVNFIQEKRSVALFNPMTFRIILERKSKKLNNCI